MQNTTIMVCRMTHLCYWGFQIFAVPLQQKSLITDNKQKGNKL